MLVDFKSLNKNSRVWVFQSVTLIDDYIVDYNQYYITLGVLFISHISLTLTSRLIILNPSCFAFSSAFSKTALARPNPLAHGAKKKVLRIQE